VALICDTGPLYAAMDRADADHEVCARLLSDSVEPLLVPAPVVVELDWLAGTVVDLVRADYVRVCELLARYADLRLGFVDAAVVTVVERLGEPKLATFDHRHFGTIRPRHVDALELLPA
jgi:predicted nucleic acid-binding protein